jgi:predicted deacetylase
MYPAKFILRFDDVTQKMAWSKFLPVKKELERLGVKSVLGVVPACLDESLNVEPIEENFFDYVRHWLSYGDAILQHGTYHRYKTRDSGILGINNSSEFSGLDYEEQYKCISKGKVILQEQGCWEPFFMAPSHSFDRNTLKALVDHQFIAISDGYGFYPYRQHGIVFVPQLFSSPKKFLPGISTICVHINNMTASQIRTLLAFIKTEKHRFLNFKNVVREMPKVSEGPFIRALTGLTVKTIRSVRR